ncbi:hypothetical protein FGB62_57g03 [Gracilaria domingensis]|nr:hypothetical protein FGB62_57g03 [Gracilaria domingensis]
MRKAALRAMTGLFQNTGCVIKRYDAHRALFSRFLLTLETEQDVRLKVEILIGSLGDVNSEDHEYINLPLVLERRLYGQTRDMSSSGQERGTLRNYSSFISAVQIVPSSTSHLPSSKLAALVGSGKGSTNVKREGVQADESGVPKRSYSDENEAKDDSQPAFLNPIGRPQDIEPSIALFAYGGEHLESIMAYRLV